MDEPNLDPDYSYPLFQSPDLLGQFVLDRLKNDKGAMTSSELAAALYHLAINLDHYTKECAMLRMELNNVMGGAELAQQMMDKIEEHREQHLVRKKIDEDRRATPATSAKPDNHP